MRKVLPAVLLALATVASPARAQFCPGGAGWVYDDVLASDSFCGYITWMAQNGVSLGCQIIDANHRLYCPNANVTRTQMAAFMNRLTTQPDSASPTVGTITKPGGVFLHNAGVDNTFLGVGAGNFASGDYNTGIGTKALAANELLGTRNVAVGRFALTSNKAGGYNTAVGHQALRFNTSGFGNTAMGEGAMQTNATGSYNTGIGITALGSNVIGAQNTAIGTGAMGSTTTGNNNTAAGTGSMQNNDSGSSNTAVGFLALSENVSGSANAGLAAYALASLQTGAENVAIGFQSLRQVTSGDGNIGIGSSAGFDLISGSDNIYLGNVGSANDNQTTRIGFAQIRTFLAGIRGVTTGANDAVAVVIDSNGQLGTVSSSRDAKNDIADMRDASAALMQLRPVTFHYKADRDSAGPRLQYGLIAEEVAEVYPGMVATKDGKPETVMYQYLAPMLLNEYQKQQRTIEAQAREIERQRLEIADVKMSQSREIADLRRAVETLMARTSNDERIATR
ncbi:MAG: tail fiber domain-containing protein [Burkholderiales bacterium]